MKGVKAVKVTVQVTREDDTSVTQSFDLLPEYTEIDLANLAEHCWPSRFAKVYPMEVLLTAGGKLQVQGLIKADE